MGDAKYDKVNIYNTRTFTIVCGHEIILYVCMCMYIYRYKEFPNASLNSVFHCKLEAMLHSQQSQSQQLVYQRSSALLTSMIGVNCKMSDCIKSPADLEAMVTYCLKPPRSERHTEPRLSRVHQALVGVQVTLNKDVSLHIASTCALQLREKTIVKPFSAA